MIFRRRDDELHAALAGLGARLDGLDARVQAIARSLAALAREEELREQLARKREELDALAQQSLHVVEQLDEARRRIRELERRAAARPER